MIANIDTMAGREVSLGQLEGAALAYDNQSTLLEAMVDDLEADLEAVKAKHLAALKRQAAVVARREAELHSLIERGAGLFTKPRTVTWHGVKLGLTTSVGKLVYDDADAVLRLIRKHRKDDADVFIHTREEPNKENIKAMLTASEQLQIGCRVEGAGDVVVLKRVAGEVEKMFDKLITKFVETMVKGDA